MKKLFILILISTLFSSCSILDAFLDTSIPYGSYQAGDYKYTYNYFTVKIISEPAGAAIEWNNEYVGKTPLEFPVNGSLGNGVTIMVKATLGSKIDYKYIKNPVPSTIYFNLGNN